MLTSDKNGKVAKTCEPFGIEVNVEVKFEFSVCEMTIRHKFKVREMY